jgi:hypothetical protein
LWRCGSSVTSAALVLLPPRLQDPQPTTAPPPPLATQPSNTKRSMTSLLKSVAGGGTGGAKGEVSELLRDLTGHRTARTSPAPWPRRGPGSMTALLYLLLQLVVPVPMSWRWLDGLSSASEAAQAHPV